MSGLERLAGKLPAAAVKEREGPGGTRLSYVDGHYVYQLLVDVFGPGGWGYTVTDREVVAAEKTEGRGKPKWRVAYLATVRLWVLVDGERREIEDVGYGDASCPEYQGAGPAHESAAKEAVTDGVKRCARALGPAAGLALYDKAQADVSGPLDELASALDAAESGPVLLAVVRRHAPNLQRLDGRQKREAWGLLEAAGKRAGVGAEELRAALAA